MFARDQHYSQTEACKRFSISIKTFQKIVEQYEVEVTEKEITLHTSPEGLPYEVKTKYVYKIDFIRALCLYNNWVVST